MKSKKEELLQQPLNPPFLTSPLLSLSMAMIICSNMYIYLLLLVSSSLHLAQICNGSPAYCSLRFDQITLAGSHGAGAGNRGRVKNCDGLTSNSDTCIFQTQDLSIGVQLCRGVRFLSLDICILPQPCNMTAFGDLSMSRLVSCQGSEDTQRNGFRYGGRLIDVLDQVDNWLSNNTNEVIGLHFTRNIPSSNKSQTGQMIASLLESKWGEGAADASIRSSETLSATEMSTFFRQNGSWPTLLTAITENRRIIVYFDLELIQASFMSSLWLHPPPYVTLSPFTRSMIAVDADCTHLDNVTCSETNSDTIVLSGYGYLLCLNDAQRFCNEKLDTASYACFDSRIVKNLTLNVVLVDYVGMGPVYNITSELNRRNVQLFAPPAIPTTPAIATNTTFASTMNVKTDTISLSPNNGQPVNTTDSESGTYHMSALSYSLLFFILIIYLYITL